MNSIDSPSSGSGNSSSSPFERIVLLFWGWTLALDSPITGNIAFTGQRTVFSALKIVDMSFPYLLHFLKHIIDSMFMRTWHFILRCVNQLDIGTPVSSYYPRLHRWCRGCLRLFSNHCLMPVGNAHCVIPTSGNQIKWPQNKGI